MKTHPFVEAVASLQFENCFNPYSDRCEVHDRRDAPRRRTAALSAMLRCALEEQSMQYGLAETLDTVEGAVRGWP